MTEYKPGQRLTLTHEEWPAPLVWTVYRDGRYIEHPGLGGMFLHQLEEGVSITHVDGYPVPETPPLPTEPGIYVPREVGSVAGRIYRLSLGSNEWSSWGRTDEEAARDVLGVDPVRVMTLDEARPTIAAEVTDWMRSAHLIGREPADVTRDHFGVSE